jgi:squid-like protein/heterogeneous nuclear ribonucleoprotein A1/A3
MTIIHARRLAAALCGIGLMILGACAVTGVGVDGSVGVGYDAGYYEPYGYEYGGWGPGYVVGPGRGGDRRGGGPHPGGANPGGSGHGYRPAPSFRPTPSIPARSRGR